MRSVRVTICAGFVVTGLAGCVHTPLNYPGSSTSSIEPSNYVNAPCPNFTGTYKGVGYLIDGDSGSKRSAGTQRLSFDMIFPILSDRASWANVQRNYLPNGSNHKFAPYADYAKVKQLGPRSVEITMGYKDRVIGSYRSDYKDANVFVCKDGKLMAGGPDRITAYSEMGKNSSEQSSVLYKNDNGDIVYENRLYVHMTWLDIIPTGTAKHYTKYLFKKLK